MDPPSCWKLLNAFLYSKDPEMSECGLGLGTGSMLLNQEVKLCSSSAQEKAKDTEGSRKGSHGPSRSKEHTEKQGRNGSRHTEYSQNTQVWKTSSECGDMLEFENHHFGRLINESSSKISRQKSADKSSHNMKNFTFVSTDSL